MRFIKEFKGIEKNIEEILKELQRLEKFDKYEVFSKNYDAFSIIEENLFYYLDSIEDCIGKDHLEFDQFKYTFVILFNDLQQDYKQGNLLKLASHYKSRLKNLRKITQAMEKKLEKDEKKLIVEFYGLVKSFENIFSHKSLLKYEQNYDFNGLEKIVDTYYQQTFSVVRELFFNYGYDSVRFREFLNEFEKLANDIVEACLQGDFFEKKQYFISRVHNVLEEAKKIKKG